ncbi:MAG: hypothetical protein NTV86_00830 [Planctomycetota bacterium]|nr:hypothetical protein [Planctomycetota bacterium]
MKLADLAAKTGISLRLFRYVIDNEVVSREQLAQTDTMGEGRGVRREFSEFSGFIVSLAAGMLAAGLTRQLTKTVLQVFFNWASGHMEFRHGPASSNFLVFCRARSILLEVADATFMRVVVLPGVAGDSSTTQLRSMEWTDIATGKPAPDGYTPMILVRLGLGWLAGTLCGSKE